MMSRRMKQAACLATLVLFGLAVVKAANFRFREKQDAIQTACRAAAKATGLTASALRAKYPTPEIAIASAACVQPGQTGELVLRGKFPAGTKFVLENDVLEVIQESIVAGQYRATVKAPPGAGPQTAAISAISPGTCRMDRLDRAVVVGGKYEWVMKSGNNWKIVAKGPNAPGTGCTNSSADEYDVAFYREGQTAPFEKATATLNYSMWERENYRFRISTADPFVGSAQQKFMTIMQRMSDPKLPPAERQRIMGELDKIQAEMQAEMKKMTDPAVQKARMAQAEAKKREFGCEMIALEVPAGASFKGEMRCSQQVGARIPITGTMALVAK